MGLAILTKNIYIYFIVISEKIENLYASVPSILSDLSINNTICVSKFQLTKYQLNTEF